MTRTVTAALGAALLLATAARGSEPTPATDAAEPSPRPAITAQRVTALLDELVPAAMEEAPVPGLAVAVVYGGQPLAARGYGLADVAGERPVDPERTVFRLGSLAKPVTATTVLAVLEQSDLDLDRDVRPQLRGLPLRPSYPEPLTLRQLLTHTAGFNENLFGQHAAAAERWRPLEEYLVRRLPPRFAPPGEVIAYTDFHTALAGLVASRLAGRPFEALAEERVFGPLGMASSTFRQVDLPPALAGELALAYRRSGEGWTAYPRDYVMTTPAAGLQATASDMARYMIALLGEEGLAAAVMTPASWREQRRVQHRHHPKLPGKALGLTEVRRRGRAMLYKDGQASGFHARMLLVPDAKLGIFSVHNRSIIGAMGRMNAASRVHRNLGWALVDELLEPVETPEAAPPSAAAAWRDRRPGYLGVYRSTVASRHTAEKVITMMEDLEVTASEREGGLVIGGGEFVEVEPGLFQWHEGGEFFGAFAPDRGAGSPYFFFGTGAYERIPWIESSRATRRLAIGFVGVFVAAIAGFGWRWRALARRGADQATRQVAGALAAVAVANLLFLVAFGAVLAVTDVQRLFHGWPWTARLALALPLLGLAPLTLAARGLLTGSVRRALGLGTVAAATATVALAAAFLAWLNLWNLLGWRL